jgi:hypothetical protein
LDKIEALLKLTGGYPKFWGRYSCGSVVVMNGDQLNISYAIDVTGGEQIVLERCYDVRCSIEALGQALQGPVIRDNTTELGHRLATTEELWPDHEETLRRYRTDVYTQPA